MTDSQSAKAKATSRGRSPETKPRQPGPGGRDRRQDVLAAARRLFVARGYKDTSVAAIVREAGVAQGTFYLYFRSKEHVLARMRADVLADYVSAFQSGAGGAGGSDAALVRGLERINRAVKRHRDLLRVFRQAASGEETEQVWLEGRETLARPLARLIEGGVAEGRLAVDDPRLAAHLVLALFDNLLYEAVAYRKPASSRRTLTHASRFMLRALGAAEERVEELVPLGRGG